VGVGDALLGGDGGGAVIEEAGERAPAFETVVGDVPLIGASKCPDQPVSRDLRDIAHDRDDSYQKTERFCRLLAGASHQPKRPNVT